MHIRPATPADHAAIWQVIAPAIRAGETWALPRDMGERDALAYWTAPDREAFVAEDEDGAILGSYFLRANQPGGGAHVANGGYIVHPDAVGRGVARAMCLHSLDLARARGFVAMQFNFVVSTNDRAVRLWQSLGFEIAARLPRAFDHPVHGLVDAFIMYQLLDGE